MVQRKLDVSEKIIDAWRRNCCSELGGKSYTSSRFKTEMADRLGVRVYDVHRSLLARTLGNDEEVAIKNDYENSKISIREIAKKHGISTSRIYTVIGKYNVVRRGSPKSLRKKDANSLEVLSEDYIIAELEPEVGIGYREHEEIADYKLKELIDREYEIYHASGDAARDREADCKLKKFTYFGSEQFLDEAPMPVVAMERAHEIKTIPESYKLSLPKENKKEPYHSRGLVYAKRVAAAILIGVVGLFEQPPLGFVNRNYLNVAQQALVNYPSPKKNSLQIAIPFSDVRPNPNLNWKKVSLGTPEVWNGTTEVSTDSF